MTVPNKAASTRVYGLLHSVISFLANVIYKQEVVGVENIPPHGPYLVAANHLSILDVPLIFVNFPGPMTGMVADKWSKTPGISTLVNLVGGIWVARGEADMDAIKAALHHLRQGGIMGIAPEGTRSRTGVLQPGKTGTAYLADRTGVPIVPVGITGSEKTSYHFKRLRRTPVKFVIGQPFYLPKDGRAKGAKLDEFTDLIMCRIAALLPPEYRGVYANHPGLKDEL